MAHGVRIEKLIQQGLNNLLRSGKTPHEIASTLLAEQWHGLTDDERKELAQTGLQKAVADALKNSRNARLNSTIETNSVAREEAKKLETNVSRLIVEHALGLLDAIVLKDAKGGMLSLLRFGLDDVRQWKKEAALLEVAWTNRSMWFEEAELALLQTHCLTIVDLPKNRIVGLAERAKVAWSIGVQQ